MRAMGEEEGHGLGMRQVTLKSLQGKGTGVAP